MIRIYANSFAPGEKPWSVDRGSQDTEITVDEIVILSTLPRAFVSRVGPLAEGSPSGWLQCDDPQEQVCTAIKEGKTIAYIL